MNRQGWRAFVCSCKFIWAEPTRDRLSPSLENCPKCLKECHPVKSWPDEDLQVNAFGNLVAPMGNTGDYTRFVVGKEYECVKAYGDTVTPNWRYEVVDVDATNRKLNILRRGWIPMSCFRGD